MLEVRDLLERLREGGWTIVRQRGSHRQLRHSVKPGTVTVAGNPGDTVRPGTLKSILSQAELEQPR